MKKKSFILLLLLSINTAVTQAQSKMISMGDHSLEMVQAGTGPYTVIFESGFGTDYKVWGNVASEIMKTNTVVLYSRAGSGKSEVNPKPQTLENAVQDLSLLIEKADLKPPFIFVGHSYGAFLIRAYASLNNDKVKGLVFVDPAHEKLIQELRKADATKTARDIELQNKFVPEKFKTENELINGIFEKGSLPAFGKLPEVPAVVLTSVQLRHNPEMFLHEPAGMKIWRKLHGDFFNQFSNGAHYITANSGHNIHREEPNLVIDAIKQVIQLAEKQKLNEEYELKITALGIAFQEARPLLDKDAAAAEKKIFDGLTVSAFDEKTINGMAYQQLNNAETLALATVIFKYNTLNFASSANAFDSYGEALMKAGKLDLAKQQFGKAIELAKAAGDTSTVKNSENNLKKIDALGQ